MRCYICKSENHKKRDGKVRDNPLLSILECNNCGLVFLENNTHITDDFYINSGIHGTNQVSIENWLAETKNDDERRYKFLYDFIINKDILDFGCGGGGFLQKSKEISRISIGIELERRVREYWKNNLKIYSSLCELGEKNLI